MSATNIEWADHTINPIAGCSKCSIGCRSCYAERFAARLAKNPNPKIAAKYAGIVDKDGHWTGKFGEFDQLCFDKLPKKPRKVFVGSMTDLFHEHMKEWDLSFIINKVFKLRQHTFLFLTKRVERMKEVISNPALLLDGKPLPNLWLGVTICNQEEADEKIPILLQIPAAKRFISVEPMLGPINLWRFFPKGSCPMPEKEKLWEMAGLDKYVENPDYENGIAWVICGGETGSGARPIDLQWARDLRDQCQKAEVPFFFKALSGRQKIPTDLYIREFPDGK